MNRRKTHFNDGEIARLIDEYAKEKNYLSDNSNYKVSIIIYYI